MFITDSGNLKSYTTENRVWQGIPGIEVTKNGRIFSTFYSGGIKEGLGNFAVLVYSDNGVDFSEPIAVAYDEDHRCFDSCIWLDPLERLWFIWSVMPGDNVYAVVCEEPDAEKLKWGSAKVIGKGIMLNKPTVLETGEWLFPIALWSQAMKNTIDNNAFGGRGGNEETGAFAYRTIDNGETFEKIGGVSIDGRSYDEHMFLEFDDGCIGSYIRTLYGIGVSYSYDRGKTWTEGENSGLGGPSSRFYIGRLKSGRILLINHDDFKWRNNLTAFLSEDEGKTWKYKLLIDGRNAVSYPDVKEAEDGFIYITYDRERGCLRKTLDDAYGCAREIIFAKITEEDIISGKLINPESKLRCIVSKLGRYKYENVNLYDEQAKYSDEEMVEYLMSMPFDDILAKTFDVYSINCINLHKVENEKLDKLIEQLKDEDFDKRSILMEIIRLVRSVTHIKGDDFPIVSKIQEIIVENMQTDLTLQELAEKVGISQFYMMHRFKSITGLSINQYKNTLRMTRAKTLLVKTDRTITDIAIDCGFNSVPYFSDRFSKSEGVTPSDYRKLLKK